MFIKAREGVWKFIEKRKNIIFFLIITAITLAMRTCSIEHVSGDMYWYVRVWFDELKAGGGLPALKNNIGNYNVPYLTILALLTYLPFDCQTLVKIVSIIFDYVLAISCMILVKKLLKDNPNKKVWSLVTYGLVLMLPSVILNSACWGQCDAIYGAFSIIALIFLIDEKYIRSFIFLGIAFAFKLQFIFILPVFLLVYIQKRKFSIFYILIIPIVNLILCSPAIFAGRPFMDVVKIYYEQLGEWSYYITLNHSTIYNLFLNSNGENNIPAPNEFLGRIGTLTTISIFGIAAFISLYKKKEFDSKAILAISLWSIMLCNFLLPSMHERYGFVADVLSLIYFVVNRKNLYLPVTINLISLCEYSNFLFPGGEIPLVYLSAAYFIMLVLFTKEVFENYFRIDEDN